MKVFSSNYKRCSQSLQYKNNITILGKYLKVLCVDPKLHHQKSSKLSVSPKNFFAKPGSKLEPAHMFILPWFSFSFSLMFICFWCEGTIHLLLALLFHLAWKILKTDFTLIRSYRDILFGWRKVKKVKYLPYLAEFMIWFSMQHSVHNH